MEFRMAPRSNRMLILIAVLAVSPAWLMPAARTSQEVDRTPLAKTAASPPPAGVWRRTSQGWRRTNNWPSQADPTVVPSVARIHPGVLAALIGLLSLAGLIGFNSPVGQKIRVESEV